jgi:hypothetical protein
LNLHPFSLANEMPIGRDGCPVCDKQSTAGERTTAKMVAELQWFWRKEKDFAAKV